MEEKDMKCFECGICCKLFLINLSKEEYYSKNYETVFKDFEFIEDFEEAEMCGANILANREDGSCIYQTGNKCSIHNDRPKVCRNFFCSSDNPEFKDMIENINDEKARKS